MNTLEKRKLNLLVHLAKVDGKFDHAERKLLAEFAREKGLSEAFLEEEEEPMRHSEFSQVESRFELLHWALKLMHADGVVHPKEVLFCENMAVKLNFKKEIVFHFTHKEIPPLPEFEDEVKRFWILGL